MTGTRADVSGPMKAILEEVGLWIFSRAPNTRAQVSRERVDSPFADELV